MSDLLEDLKRAKKLLEGLSGPPVSSGLLFPFGGMPIFESEFMTETEVYEETVQLTFRQRWIEPISTFLNFQTMPFEPWVKTRTVTKTRQVPMRKVMQTQFGLFMHPLLKKEYSAILSGIVVGDNTKHSGLSAAVFGCFVKRERENHGYRNAAQR